MKRANELNVYSGIAIMFVVLIHANANYLANVLKVETYAESGYLLITIDQIIHAAVPMFIFISGFKHYLNYKKGNYFDFFKRRLFKVLIPFMVISLVFIIATSVTSYLSNSVSILTIINNVFIDFVKIFLGYNFAYQLWYIPLYLFVVLAYPLIRACIKKQSSRFILFGLLSVSYVLLANYTDIFSGFTRPFNFVYYFIFFELGCYMAKNKTVENKKLTLLISYLAVLLLSIYAVGGKYDVVITDLILTPISVCAFYYIALHLQSNKTLTTLGAYSFYIYLFHEPIFVRYLTRLFITLDLYSGYYITVIVAILAILLSISLFLFLAKTKLIYFISPKIKNRKRTKLAS